MPSPDFSLVSRVADTGRVQFWVVRQDGRYAPAVRRSKGYRIAGDFFRHFHDARDEARAMAREAQSAP